LKRLSTKESYFYHAVNGARLLLEIPFTFRLLDCTRDDENTYFLLYYHGEKTFYIQLDKDTTFELLCLHCCPDVSEELLELELTDILNHAVNPTLYVR